MLRVINGITNQDLQELLARLTEAEAAEEDAYIACGDELDENWERASDAVIAATDELRDALVKVSGGAISKSVAWLMILRKRDRLVKIINGWS